MRESLIRLLAAHALSGILTNPALTSWTPEEIAEEALKSAEALATKINESEIEDAA